MNISQPASGLACLAMLSRLHGVAADTEALLHRHGAADGSFPLSALLLSAKELGLKAKHGRFRPEALATTPLPAIACDRNGDFFILARIDSGTDARNDALSTAPAPERRVLIQDPASGRPQILPEADFLARWDGTLVLLASRASLAAELARFDFSWFIPPSSNTGGCSAKSWSPPSSSSSSPSSPRSSSRW